MKHVMIVEDDVGTREIATFIFVRRGHAVVPVADGKAAWELLTRSGKFDLIVSDYQIPGLDGLALLRRVREDSRISNTPFVLMSSFIDQSELIEACIEHKAMFVAKPATDTSINELIDHFLGVEEGGGTV